MKTITTDPSIIESIIHQATICRIAMADGGQPYLVPVCFGYENGVLYFHSSTTGKKMELLANHPAVCFELESDVEIVRAPNSCQCSANYCSVIGFGRALFLHDPQEKRQGLDAIMRHYWGQPGQYPDATLAKTAVVRIEIERMTAKIAQA